MARDPVRTVRVDDRTWEALKADLDKHNEGPTNRWMTLSDWLRAAIEERLAHRARSRKARKARKEVSNGE